MLPLKIFALASSILLVSGCASLGSFSLFGGKKDKPPAPPTAVETTTAIPTKCTAREPTVPAWAFDAATRATEVGDEVKMLRAERVQRAAYERELLVALRQCTGAPPDTTAAVPASVGGAAGLGAPPGIAPVGQAAQPSRAP